LRVYDKEKNVLDAARERMKFIFTNFRKVYVSFSGGKDSGVMLNLAIEYVRKNEPGRKFGVMIMDNEANYSHSLEFMKRIIDANRDILEVFWCCLPITLPCTVSSYEIDWQCWGVGDKDRWIRKRPEEDYVVSIDNCPFDFFKINMLDKDFYAEFAEWYSEGELCANLIGIRTSESLNRFRAIMNKKKETLNGEMWTRRQSKNTFNCYPIYDWRTEDIWTANAKFEWDYNKLYDIFYKACVPVGSMRVASPFMSESKSSLNLYRVIDPTVWAKLCARVQGANFIATYGKQLNYNSFKLPKGHTWKSFTKFLLDTLPKETSENFRKRFAQSIKYWARVGRGLPNEAIEELEKHKIRYKLNGKTRHGRKDLDRVKIIDYPDHLDMIKNFKSDIASWKRLAMCILKNDHTCKYLGLAPTKEQALRQKQIMAKYKNISIKGKAK
jgi:predicted phosphoadenosine phosphosulfate sulfurtransferase